jgi:hypothetical protein
VLGQFLVGVDVSTPLQVVSTPIYRDGVAGAPLEVVAVKTLDDLLAFEASDAVVQDSVGHLFSLWWGLNSTAKLNKFRPKEPPLDHHTPSRLMPRSPW